MAFTHISVASTPADAGSQAGPIVAVDKDAGALASLQTGDLLIAFACRRANTASIVPVLGFEAGWGGQHWSQMPASLIGATGATIHANWFYCRFNGAWTGDPVWHSSDRASTLPMSVIVSVYRPTSASKLIVPCIYPRAGTYTATGTTKTVTGITTVTQFGSQSHLVVAALYCQDDVTWGSLSGSGWSQGNYAAQYRNGSGSDMSIALMHNIQTTSGASNNVSMTQSLATAGRWSIFALTEIDHPAQGTGGTRAYVQSAITGADPGADDIITVTLDSPVTSGNTVRGLFNGEDFSAANVMVNPIFPPVSDQGDELVVCQLSHHAELNQFGLTWFLPNVTSGAQSFTLNFAPVDVTIIARGAQVLETNGGGHFRAASWEWGSPGSGAGVPEWTPLSVSAVTTTQAAHFFGAAFLPGASINTPYFDFASWGTKREEVGSAAGTIATAGCADVNQSGAGTVEVTEDSNYGSPNWTILMMVAIENPEGETPPPSAIPGKVQQLERGYSGHVIARLGGHIE